MSGNFDQSVVLSWNTFIFHHKTLEQIVKLFGIYGVYLIPIIWIAWWFLAGKKGRFLLLSSLFAGIFAWGVLNSLVKLFYHHARPITSLPVKELLFHRPENSFPSDHAAFLSAIAFLFLLKGEKKASWWLMALAIVVSLCRVALAFHYPTDILGGFVSGLIVAWYVSSVHERLCDTVWQWVLNLAHKLHLA